MFLPCTSVYDPANKIFHYTSYIIRSIVYLSTFCECRKVSVGFGCLTVWSGSALASLTIFEIGVGMIQGEKTRICVSYCTGLQGAYPVSCVNEFTLLIFRPSLEVSLILIQIQKANAYTLVFLAGVLISGIQI